VLIRSLPVTDVEPEALPELLVERVLAGRDTPVVAFGLHVGGLNARADTSFTSALWQADAVYPDGISAALLGRVAGARRARKIATPDLAPQVIEELARRLGRPLRLAVVGGRAGVASQAAQALAERLPVEPVFAVSGYEEDWPAVLRDLDERGADVLLLGLGMPLEARWVAQHRGQIPAPLVLTCGGWLRILAGLERRAPVALQKLELEWLFRAATSPRRVFRRYARGLPVVAQLAVSTFRQRQASAAGPDVVAAPLRQPAITVVVPTRDRPELLQRAVASILAQTYEGPIHVVVVFDGTQTCMLPTPRRPGLRLSALQTTRQSGPAAARNLGFHHTTDPLVAFCDDDDVWAPTKLARQVQVLDEQPAAVACVTASVFDQGSRSRVRRLRAQALALDELARNRCAAAHTSSFLIRRGDWTAGPGPFDESLPDSYGEDWDVLLRAAHVHPVAVVDEPLVRIEVGGESFYRRNWAARAEGLEALIATHPDLAAHSGAAAHVYSQLALAEAARGRRPEARAWLQQARKRRALAPPVAVATLAVSGLVSPERLLAALSLVGRSL
jgi:exopolysaccharide biosynthesis WecB/TagA/CpsF family protein